MIQYDIIYKLKNNRQISADTLHDSLNIIHYIWSTRGYQCNIPIMLIHVVVFLSTTRMRHLFELHKYPLCTKCTGVLTTCSCMWFDFFKVYLYPLCSRHLKSSWTLSDACRYISHTTFQELALFETWSDLLYFYWLMLLLILYFQCSWGRFGLITS